MSKSAELWNYIKPELFIKNYSTYENPLIFDYTNQSVTTVKLVPKLWMVAGLVVQKVYYSPQHVLKDPHHIPVVHEEWDWLLDPETLLVLARTITSSCYQADTETPQRIEDFSTSRIKYYTSYSMQLQEIRQRRQNHINHIEEIIIKTLLPIVAEADVRTAVLLATSFMNHLREPIQQYVTNGTFDLVKALYKKELRKSFPWLEKCYTFPETNTSCFYEYLIQYLMQDPVACIEQLDRSLFII